MRDVAAMIDAAVRAECADAGQITLGVLIAQLSCCKLDSYISLPFAGLTPGRMRSYRGYYSHLAIEPDNTFCVVGEFLDHARSVLGTTMTGYKGGGYVMGPQTPVWVAVWGTTSDTRVVGVKDEGWNVVLECS